MSSTAYTDLRQQAPRLALALLFQNERQKQQLATLLLFGLELDRIVAQVSEPMLALIRLKWWEEQVEEPTPDAGPLAGYLHDQIRGGSLTRTQVSALTSQWAATVQAGDSDVSQNWSGLLTVMATVTGLHPCDMPQEVGRAVALSRAGQPANPPAAREIHQACGKGSEFLICLAWLSDEAGRRDLERAPLLIFSILYQVMFKPASR